MVRTFLPGVQDLVGSCRQRRMSCSCYKEWLNNEGNLCWGLALGGAAPVTWQGVLLHRLHQFFLQKIQSLVILVTFGFVSSKAHCSKRLQAFSVFSFALHFKHFILRSFLGNHVGLCCLTPSILPRCGWDIKPQINVAFIFQRWWKRRCHKTIRRRCLNVKKTLPKREQQLRCFCHLFA